MEKKEIKIGIPSKGPLYAPSIELMEKAGIKIQKAYRVLVVESKFEENDLLLGFLRPKDIVKRIKSGQLDLGIVGEDTIAEMWADRDLNKIMGLGFGRCRLVVAVPAISPVREIAKLAGSTIATSFPNMTSYMFSKLNIPITLTELDGCVEASYKLRFADAIADLCETGETLDRNYLREIDVIYNSQAVLIINQQISQGRYKFLKNLIFALWNASMDKGEENDRR